MLRKSTRAQQKGALGKVWHFIWYDNSLMSWIANTILAFVIIKFLVYPGMGLVLGTSYPVVAVVSKSMEHNTGFDKWWNKDLCCNSDCSITQKPSDYYTNNEILFSDFAKFPLRNGFNKGDIMILVKPEDLKTGDVIVFKSLRPEPIIHRIVKIQGEVYETKGDNNCEQIKSRELDETSIKKEDLLGKAVVRLPLLGWVKIWFVEFINVLR